MEDKYFDEIDKEAIDTLFKEMDVKIDKKVDTVYHYTTKSTLFNIVENCSLRFSNIYRLNDPLEIEFGLSVIKKIFKDESTVLEIISDYERKAIYDADFYIFSTSAEHDIHQQWINYAERGKGVAIGFNRIKFFEKIKEKMGEGSLCYIYPVVYYDEKLEIVDQRIYDFENTIYNHMTSIVNENNKYSETIQKELINLILIMASLIKNEFHKEEQEWRYFILSNKKNFTKYILKDKEIQQIVEIVFNYKNDYQNKLNVGISKVILGPHVSNDDIVKQEIYSYLSDKIDGSEIMISRSRGYIR
ncbi:DUF2971 domain-containing protein [Sediminispirochaeta smaragdinae]|uniref:DUF2971 domain-containing protein n=1 Tax=Sediminispirochaeta smaragdinae (strain DSM 11293 / JCM 15392 / SEBR 4228) TaxID=573413 RepID=E1R241_SEDSS|nr:DUF2971 domain-containing protein [Sediminispirochaeta smaragdinae]ADK81926.1 hypothetical protein Spirs_2823 [Sediminispirochaeta smaragdinae DSM 11293]